MSPFMCRQTVSGRQGLSSVRFVERLGLFGAAAGAALLLAAAPAVAADAKPTVVIQAEATKDKKPAYIDDAFALSEDGSTLYYVLTDGLNSAKLRGVKLPAAGAAPPSGKPGPSDLVLEITGVPLNTYKMWLLPDNKAMLVLRDLDTAGLLTAMVYDLKTKQKVSIAGGTDGMIGPATEIVLSLPPAATAAPAPAPAPAPAVKGGKAAPVKVAAAPAPFGPAILAFTRTEPEGGPPTEYTLKAWSHQTLKPLGQKSWKVSGSEGRVTTPQGSGQALYFLADYQVLAVKHGGAYDKKKDIREPDYLAYLDVLGGKLRGSRPLADPTGLLELSRLRSGHGESLLLRGDPETDKIELFTAQDFERPEGPIEKRVLLSLPRPSNMYEMTSLRSQPFGAEQLLISATVDPVNEKAVAEKRTDPDTIDFCTIELKSPEAPARARLSIPGNKRPNAWMVTSGGRLALLRKHKSFSRGGSEIEIYDFPAK